MLTNAPLDMEYVRAQFPGLQSGWVFFDNAGGSQILKGAVERINTFLYEKNVQIGGSYEVSVAAANALKEARDAARVLVNAQRSDEIVFGASTTVLMQNLAAAMRSQLSPGDEIVICVADHESNIGPWDRLSEFGIVIKTWPINHETLKLELSDLEPLMSDRTRLVCVHHVSNILGEINPIREIADFVHHNAAKVTPQILHGVHLKLPQLKLEFAEIHAPKYPHLVDQLEIGDAGSSAESAVCAATCQSIVCRLSVEAVASGAHCSRAHSAGCCAAMVKASAEAPSTWRGARALERASASLAQWTTAPRRSSPHARRLPPPPPPPCSMRAQTRALASARSPCTHVSGRPTWASSQWRRTFQKIAWRRRR